MICSLKLIYNDNKDLVIKIAEENLPAFFGSLNAKQMYFDNFNKMGFWTDLDKIRYVQALKDSSEEETSSLKALKNNSQSAVKDAEAVH
jgi:hypothetical protein